MDVESMRREAEARDAEQPAAQRPQGGAVQPSAPDTPDSDDEENDPTVFEEPALEAARLVKVANTNRFEMLYSAETLNQLAGLLDNYEEDKAKLSDVIATLNVRWGAYHALQCKEAAALSDENLAARAMEGFDKDLWKCSPEVLLGATALVFWTTFDKPAYTLPPRTRAVTCSTHERYALGFVRFAKLQCRHAGMDIDRFETKEDFNRLVASMNVSFSAIGRSHRINSER